MEYRKLEIEHYNELLSAKKSTPGGGSALAITLSLACSLCNMVINFTMNKKGYEHLIDFKDRTIYIDSSINVDDFYLKFYNYKFDLSKYHINNSYNLRIEGEYFFFFPDEIYEDFKEIDGRYVVFNTNKSDADKIYSELNNKSIHTERTTDKSSDKTIVNMIF